MLRKTPDSHSTRTRHSSATGAKPHAVDIKPAPARRDTNDNFLLGTSEFFMGEKDSLLLSAADIFSTAMSTGKLPGLDVVFDETQVRNEDSFGRGRFGMTDSTLHGDSDQEKEEERDCSSITTTSTITSTTTSSINTSNTTSSSNQERGNDENRKLLPQTLPPMPSLYSAHRLPPVAPMPSSSTLPRDLDKTRMLLGMKRHGKNQMPLAKHPLLQAASQAGLTFGRNSGALSSLDAGGILAERFASASASAASAADRESKLDKGLRHFSAKVCAKVEEKGSTSYNEVADELVHEIGLELGKFDHKNIRRRVYDALNVLMAIDIIRKDKKEIRWLGLPNETVDDLRSLETERVAIQQRIAEKSRGLREILRRCLSLKNLIDRNASLERSRLGGVTTADASSNDRLHLPFILISAARDCHVHCEMLEDRTQYFFEFNTAFQINEDIELMRLMGLDTARVEQVKSFIPRDLISHVLMLCLSQGTAASTAANSQHAPNVFGPAPVIPPHSSSEPPSP